MDVTDKIVKVSRQLYPRGRAFRMPIGGVFEKFNKALARSESRVCSDVVSILYSILPDNDNFTVDDASDWERRLGLISNPNVGLNERKLAIIRKMNHPGTIKARQNYLYLQYQLQLAGFDVYIYENRFLNGSGGYDTKSPEEVFGISFISDIEHGDIEHGEVEHGGVFNNLIANYIEESGDFGFEVGDNLYSTFFIGGNPIGTFADVDVNRRDELRQLILRIKPTQTVGFMAINYI